MQQPRWELVISSADGTSPVWPQATNQMCLIGRGVRIGDPYMPRTHCQIEAFGPRWMLKNLGNSSGSRDIAPEIRRSGPPNRRKLGASAAQPSPCLSIETTPRSHASTHYDLICLGSGTEFSRFRPELRRPIPEISGTLLQHLRVFAFPTSDRFFLRRV